VEGRQVKELDVVRIYHDGNVDNPAQPENVLVADRAWKLVEEIDPAGARKVLDDHVLQRGPLFGNRGRSVPTEDALAGLESSIALIEPRTGVTFWTRAAYGKLSPRATFDFSGRSLDLTITDYRVAPAVLRAGEGEHGFEDLGLDCVDPVMTISLAEPKDDWCSKLVAGFPCLLG
jgi:hypothetical protein